MSPSVSGSLALSSQPRRSTSPRGRSSSRRRSKVDKSLETHLLVIESSIDLLRLEVEQRLLRLNVEEGDRLLHEARIKKFENKIDDFEKAIASMKQLCADLNGTVVELRHRYDILIAAFKEGRENKDADNR